MEGSRVQSNNKEPATGSIPSFLRPTPPPPPKDRPSANETGLIYPGDQIILPMWLKLMLISGILVFFLSSVLGSISTLSFIGSNYDYEDRAFWGIIISMVFQIGLFLMAFASFFIAFIKKDMDMRVRKGFLIAFTLFMFLISYSSWVTMMGLL